MSQSNLTYRLQWERLRSLPDVEGFAAPFAGISGDALIVAGGANFPEKRPWNGGAKRWYDSVFVLSDQNANWITVGRLSAPNAYGISISTPEGLICAGGGNAHRHLGEVFCLTWDGYRLTQKQLPDLPRPCAFAAGTCVDHTIYIAGGIDTPSASSCLNTLWALDLRASQLAWKQLPPCPGPERMLAVAGAAHGSLFLFSGAHLAPGSGGKLSRTCLRDAWRFSLDKGWIRLADLPRAAVAAVSPAPCEGGDKLLVISGDDGSNSNFTPVEEHPGFPRDVLAYDIGSDTWEVIGHAPFSRATAPVTEWHGKYVIVNGEVRPGYRTPDVQIFTIARHEHTANGKRQSIK